MTGHETAAVTELCAARVVLAHTASKARGMDLPSHLAAVAVGIVAGATLSETTEPLVRTIGGWAGFGTAVMCLVEAGRDDPRWDRAAGTGAAWGAFAGSLVVLHDVVSTW